MFVKIMTLSIHLVRPWWVKYVYKLCSIKYIFEFKKKLFHSSVETAVVRAETAAMSATNTAVARAETGSINCPENINKI